MLSAIISKIFSVVPSLTAGRDATFWLQRQASDFAYQVDDNWALVYWISIFFFLLITFLLLLFTFKFRQRPGYKPEKATSLSLTIRKGE